MRSLISASLYCRNLIKPRIFYSPCMKDKLFTPSYYFILTANFLLFFGFWFLMPVLPFYLKEIFNVGSSVVCASAATL